MITESPDRIRVTPRWSSAASCKDAPSAHIRSSSFLLRHLSLIHSTAYSSLPRVNQYPFVYMNCRPIRQVCKVFSQIFCKSCYNIRGLLTSFCPAIALAAIIFRSNVCISYRFRMGMARYVQPSYQRLQYRTSSALSKVSFWSPRRKLPPTVAAHTANQP